MAETENKGLIRGLRLWDLVLFNLAAVCSITWTATAARSGPGILLVWAGATVLFFIPLGLTVTRLASFYPDEGGIYAWTKRAFGERHGFICGWCYWINNVLFYPMMLVATAAIAVYALGLEDSGLIDNTTYVFLFTIGALWVASFLNIAGLETGKWLQNLGGFSIYISGLTLVVVGIIAAFLTPAANTFTPSTLMPDLSDISTLNLWATIAFAFAGLELSATMGSEIHQPDRTLPRSILISAPFIAVIYILGTGAILWLIPATEISLVAGPFQAIAEGAAVISTRLWWITPVAAGLMTLGRLGSLGAWLAGPARVAFVVGLDRYFPPAFGRIHPRWHTPYVVILVQAVLGTLFLCIAVLGKGTTVEKAWLVLLDTTLLLYFIPYMYLFLSMVKLNREQKQTGAGSRVAFTAIGVCGLLITLLAIGVALIPPPETHDPWMFRLKVIGGTLLLLVVGGVFYFRGQRNRV